MDSCGLGFLCMLVLGPPLLAVLGLLHAAMYTMPAATLARSVTRHAPGPEGAWHLASVLVLGTLWAALAVALGGLAPTGTTALLIAVSGVPPTLGVAFVRRRERVTGRPPSADRVWLRSALVALGACVLVVAAGTVGLATGLIQEYEPPKLGADRLTGVWRGDHGAELRLRADGRAELSAVPAQPEFGDVTTKEFTRCDGAKTWFLDTASTATTRTPTGPSPIGGTAWSCASATAATTRTGPSAAPRPTRNSSSSSATPTRGICAYCGGGEGGRVRVRPVGGGAAPVHPLVSGRISAVSRSGRGW